MQRVGVDEPLSAVFLIQLITPSRIQ